MLHHLNSLELDSLKFLSLLHPRPSCHGLHSPNGMWKFSPFSILRGLRLCDTSQCPHCRPKTNITTLHSLCSSDGWTFRLRCAPNYVKVVVVNVQCLKMKEKLSTSIARLFMDKYIIQSTCFRSEHTYELHGAHVTLL